MATMFEETTINGMTLANRFVRSATWEGLADEVGRPTKKLVELYRGLARGGVGLLVSGFAFVRADGRSMPLMMGIHTDEFAVEYIELIDAVHQAGGKIAIQLAHAGGQTEASMAGRQSLAPSAVTVAQFSEEPAELTRDEIGEIVRAFREGARRAKAWGFDAVQFHAGHGYLISQFLSPHTNQRSDEYGGSIENRCRFFLEVYRAVREEVGDGYPVMAKMNITDYLEGGLETEDGLRVARLLCDAGLDAIEVSAGTMVSGDKMPLRGPEKEAYHLDLARLVKAAVSCPVMVVGGFRSCQVAEQAVATDGIDYVAISRPLIREPDLPNLWLGGDRQPSTCISCNGCIQPGLEGRGVCCVIPG